jgi:hypothetical protein
MSRLDEGFPPPTACVQWCQHRSYDLHVLDDGVEVDLDWWNGHLDRAGHDLRLRGRNLDGEVVEYGGATVQRNDLRVGTDLAVGEHDSLGLLFLCAAWQGSHRHRRAMRRFPDVMNPHLSRPDENPVAKTLAVLDSCVRNPCSARPSELDLVRLARCARRRDVPDGHVPVAREGVGLRRSGAADRPIRRLDTHHEGWLEDPSVTGFTRRRYDRYIELVTAWATDIDTSHELVEMWLVQRWSAGARD